MFSTAYLLDQSEPPGRSFLGGSDGKESVYNAQGLGSIPGLGWSTGRGYDNSVFLPGESPWTEEPGGLESVVSQRVGLTEQLSIAEASSQSQPSIALCSSLHLGFFPAAPGIKSPLRFSPSLFLYSRHPLPLRVHSGNGLQFIFSCWYHPQHHNFFFYYHRETISILWQF